MIEQINNIAGMWWGWMWPMFWQVGLLIVLIGLLDLLLLRRVWPQVRYALWLLVLVKLILPPSLALPTSLVSALAPVADGIMRQQPMASQVYTPQIQSVFTQLGHSQCFMSSLLYSDRFLPDRRHPYRPRCFAGRDDPNDFQGFRPV